MARRASPSPPKRLSDAQLEKARPHEIERHLAEHEAFAERLDRIADPGRGKPTPEADKAREQHLAQIKKQTDEVVRLAAALPPEPDPMRSPGVMEKLRRINRHAVTHAPRSQEERAAARATQEAALERERQRAAKREIAKISERRKHPPDPRASSVLAAVMSSRFLADALERRLRDDILVVEEGRERRVPRGAFVNARILEAKDVAVLYLAAVTIEDGGLLRTHDPDRGLSTITDIPGSLRNLRVNGLLDVTRDGNTWRVAWGERARRIAREAGVVDIPSAVAAEPEAVLTRS